jgi:hypothetical protein
VEEKAVKKEVLNRIISEISSEKLTSSECREIANALKKQHNVIGGALYTWMTPSAML